MKKLIFNYNVVLFLSLFLVLNSCDKNSYPLEITVFEIPDGNGFSYLVRPSGEGPFPGVLYNHGGFDIHVGGDLLGTCLALAENGFLAMAEKRTEQFELTGMLDEVTTALNELTNHEDVNDQIAIMGYSRGGLLSLQASITEPDLIDAIVLMAPSRGINTLDSVLNNLGTIDDPVLLQVAINDTLQDNHLQIVDTIEYSLQQVGVIPEVIYYEDYDANNNGVIDAMDDGHFLFEVVQNPYWDDIINFLNINIK